MKIHCRGSQFKSRRSETGKPSLFLLVARLSRCRSRDHGEKRERDGSIDSVALDIRFARIHGISRLDHPCHSLFKYRISYAHFLCGESCGRAVKSIAIKLRGMAKLARHSPTRAKLIFASAEIRRKALEVNRHSLSVRAVAALMNYSHAY